jgi:hypothetical protein
VTRWLKNRTLLQNSRLWFQSEPQRFPFISGGAAEDPKRIRAAIEVSNKYIDQAIDADYVVDGYRAGERNPEDIAGVAKHYARLEYIAYLGNVGLINVNYLSPFLTCSIVDMPASLERNKDQINFVISSAEAAKFQPPKTISCQPPKRD